MSREVALRCRRPLVHAGGAILLVLLQSLAAVTAAPITFAAGESATIVASPKSALEDKALERLARYLGEVLDAPPRVVANLNAAPADAPSIVLATGSALDVAAPASDSEAYALETRTVGRRPVIFAVGHTERGLKRAVQRLIIAGEQSEAGFAMPEMKVSETPWIAKREWAPAGWTPDRVRGYFHNPNADRRPNIWLYSDKQIADYVAMFDAFGFSGCQLHETALGYSVVGSVDAYQDRMRKFAVAVKDVGGDVTLWVWAAQFNGYGWIDPTATYKPAEGMSPFDDPNVRATFERYYDGYARLAPHADLLIAHYYDPGQLKDRADVFRYMRLLFDKFRAKNPNVQLGVDFWAAGSDSQYMEQLIDNGFGDVLLLENSMPHLYPPGKREALHEEARRHNIKLGVWGWYTAELETDQNPTMLVNAELLSDFYRKIKNGVHQTHPLTYWSEMEAYHLNNIFTMYSASQLLWNPDRDPDEILREIADGIYGPRNGSRVYEALKLIQDTRTGPTWDTYWMWLPTHRLGTADPEEDLRRANEAIGNFEKMEMDPRFVPKFPLPFPPATFIELTLPHLRQIRHFADFRLKHRAIVNAAERGLSKEELTRLARDAWDPVPELNTWIGAFGQLESVTQEKMMIQLGRDLGITVATPQWLRWRDAERQLQYMQNRQRGSSKPLRFSPKTGTSEFNWTAEKATDRFQVLIENGCVEDFGDGLHRLANWEHYRQQ